MKYLTDNLLIREILLTRVKWWIPVCSGLHVFSKYICIYTSLALMSKYCTRNPIVTKVITLQMPRCIVRFYI